MAPSILGAGGESLHLRFSDPEVREDRDGLHLDIPETRSYLIQENWPAIPVQKIFRQYPAGTRIQSVNGSVASARTKHLRFHRPLAGNGGIRPLNGAIADIRYKPLDFVSDFPAEPVHYQVFRGMDPDALEPVVWLVINVYPLQMTAPDAVRFHPEITISIQTVSVGNHSSHTTNRSNTVCFITPDAFIPDVAPLIQHKIDGGVQATAIALTDCLDQGTGRDDPEKLRDCIRQLHEINGTIFFVLLGDADTMPVRYCAQEEDPLGVEQIPSDNYFADLYDAGGNFIQWDHDNDDRFGEYPDDLPDMDFAPDVFVMRIPASTATELNTAIQHIIQYESVPSHNENWLNTVVFAAVDTFNAETHGETSGIPEGEQYAEMLVTDIFTDEQVIRLYETDTYPKDDVCHPENVPPAVGSGAGYLAFHCHGAPDCFQLAEYDCFDHTHAAAMNNGHKLPLVYGFACSTAAFDNELPGYPYSTGAESMPEHFLLNPQGGAIAYIGATRVAFASGFGHDQHMTGSGAIEYWFWNAIKLGAATPGQMYARAQIDYLRHVGVRSVYDYITILEHNAFGDASVSFGGWLPDPCLSIYTQRMVNPATGGPCLTPGDTGDLTLRIICEGAPVSEPVFQVTTGHPDISVIQGTVAIDSLPRMSAAEIGPFTIQVGESCPPGTHIPFELIVFDGSTEISRLPLTIYIGSGPYLAFDALTWQYESHKNAHADPGETLYLTVTGTNKGCESMVNPVITMNSDSPWLVALEMNDVGEHGEIPPEHAYISPWYRLTATIDELCPHGTVIPFHASVIADNGGAWETDFNLTVEDFRGPRMWQHTIPERILVPGSNVLISVCAVDVSGIESVQAAIHRYPDGVTEFVNLDWQTGDEWSAEYQVPQEPGDFIIDMIAQDGRGNIQSDIECLTFSTRRFSEENILVINCSGDTESVNDVCETLRILGDNPAHWDIRFRGDPDLTDVQLLDPDSIFLLYGLGGEVEPEQRAWIDLLFNDGAGIVISGWDVLRNTRRAGGSDWLETVFGVSVSGGNTESYALTGIAGDPFYDGLEIRLKRKTGSTWYTGDEITPVNGGVTAVTFNETDPPMAAAIFRQDTGLRSISFPFAIEHAKTADDLQLLLEPIRNYLADHPANPVFELVLNQEMFVPGDPFILRSRLKNPYPDLLDAVIFVALEVGEDYWFWPSWIQYPSGVDSKDIQVSPFLNWNEDVLTFTWPDVTGPGPEMQFIGAAVDSSGILLDDLVIQTFSF